MGILNIKNIHNLRKTALINAVFFICISILSFSVFAQNSTSLPTTAKPFDEAKATSSKNSDSSKHVNQASVAQASKKSIKKKEIESFNELKKKITALLIMRQRLQALNLVNEALNSYSQPEINKNIESLKVEVLTQFFNQENQDIFETASNNFTSQPKTTQKLVNKCLELEPENFNCLWLQLKLLADNKDSSRFNETKTKINVLVKNLEVFKPLLLPLELNQESFLKFSFNDNDSSALYDAKIIHLILEFERSFKVKNYSQSITVLNKLKSEYADFPDSLIFEARLENLNSTISGAQKVSDLLAAYKLRCESAPSKVIKKYFFDLNFCKRKID